MAGLWLRVVPDRGEPLVANRTWHCETGLIETEEGMANGKQAAAKKMKMAERAQMQMAVHFPNVPAPWLWHRKTNDGWITTPRIMPIVMQAIDAQSKGQPAGHTLFCLWARSPDHPVITIENPSTFAAEAGFVGERAVDTWRRRMKRLRELNFIQTKPGASGEFHYVMLVNPSATMEWMRQNGLMQDNLYSRFIDRMVEVGAFGDIEKLREYWAEQTKAAEAATAAAAAAIATVPPSPNTAATPVAEATTTT
jgi:hypothetical protein